MHSKYGILIGARLLVKPETPTDSITARAAKAGLVAVVEDRNKPRPTVGEIVALGNDPSLVEMGFRIGLRVSFSAIAGDREFIEGEEFRLLDFIDIKRILPPAPLITETEPGQPLRLQPLQPPPPEQR
jgi:co-chaperonin GroES (HSP10)